jgi:hypothetical protein
MRNPTKAELDHAISDSAEIGKAQEAAPTWADLQHAFPDGTMTDTPDGKRNFHIEDHTPEKKRLRALEEMFIPKNRIEAEVGFKKNARHKEVILKDPRGGFRVVREEFEERVERKTGARRNGRVMFGGRSPRCWDQGHDFRNGRCWHCGKTAERVLAEDV